MNPNGVVYSPKVYLVFGFGIVSLGSRSKEWSHSLVNYKRGPRGVTLVKFAKPLKF